MWHMCVTAPVWRSEDTGISCLRLELSSGPGLDTKCLSYEAISLVQYSAFPMQGRGWRNSRIGRVLA